MLRAGAVEVNCGAEAKLPDRNDDPPLNERPNEPDETPPPKLCPPPLKPPPEWPACWAKTGETPNDRAETNATANIRRIATTCLIRRAKAVSDPNKDMGTGSN